MDEQVWVRNVLCEEGERDESIIYHVGDGWHYHYNNKVRNTVYLRCVLYDTLNCRGRAIVRLNQGFRHSQVHEGHEADVDYPEVLALRRNIMRRCRSLDYAPFSAIFREKQQRFNRIVAARLSMASIKTSMLNARKSNYPPVPASLLDLTHLLRNPQYEVLTMTLDGEDNLYAGSTTDALGDHHILLASQRMRSLMCEMTILFSDGTFKITPSVPSLQNRRSQVFCILTTWNFHTIPLAWSIMESRTEAAYEAVLTLLRDLLPHWRAERIIMDDERAQQNAWDNTFHPLRIQSCLWHICRSFVSKLMELGLGHWFHQENAPHFLQIVRMACALPLLPPQLLRLGLQVLRREAQYLGGNFLANITEPFFDYLSTYWVNNDHRRRTMSCYLSEHRTNNVCESHNSLLLQKLGLHSNVFAFLKGIAGVEDTAYTDALTLHLGFQASRGRKTRALNNDAVIQNLTEELLHPPMGINDSVRRFLIQASQRVQGIVNHHMMHH